MKITKLFILLILASAGQLIAMEEIKETLISPEFNYFDKIAAHVDGSFGLFIIVTARHLPTMRTYSAFFGNNTIQGYYQEKGEAYEKRVALDTLSAEAVFKTLIKVFPDTPHEQKKPLLDCLHTELFSNKQNQKKNITQLALGHVSVK